MNKLLGLLLLLASASPAFAGTGSRDFVLANTDAVVLSSAPAGSVPITLAIWSRSDSQTATQSPMVLGRSLSVNPFVGIIYRGSTTDAVRVQHINDLGTVAFADSTTDYTADKWEHTAGTFATALQEVFFKGVEEAENAATPGTTTLDRTAVGCWQTTIQADHFSGELAEARVYSKVLVDYEVKELHAGSFQTIVENLLVWWPLWDNGSPATIQDLSGQNNDGTNDGTDEGASTAPPRYAGGPM